MEPEEASPRDPGMQGPPRKPVFALPKEKNLVLLWAVQFVISAL